MTADRHTSPPTGLRRSIATAVSVLLAVAAIVVIVLAFTGPPEVTEQQPADAGSIGGGAVAADPATPSSAIGEPTRIEVPAIGVVSPVDQVGLRPDGELEVPQPGPSYDHAAWYRDSPVPGRAGPAVIIGHVDSAADGPSVFYRLADLDPGDTIEVADADDRAAVFVVDEVRSFPKNAFPTTAVYGDTARSELRLITCSGAFNSAERSYDDNTVVFAHRIHGAADPG